MVTNTAVAMLIVIAVLGHAMALFWLCASRFNWKVCGHTIYAIPIPRQQIKREIKNSIHAPIHSVILLGFLLLNFANNPTWVSFVISLLLTAVWAEVWHYISHRIFHTPRFHWIHVEHHKSPLSSPFTALSFSFTEKLVFNLGILGLLAVIDCFYSLNFFGIAAWYIGYLIINSFSHANFEIKSRGFQRFAGKVLTSTTYHSLHHSRYTKNYGLGTRILDRLFGTEWDDYVPLFNRITGDGKPLTKLGERVESPAFRRQGAA
jgi:lathosterol oxidase